MKFLLRFNAKSIDKEEKKFICLFYLAWTNSHTSLDLRAFKRSIKNRLMFDSSQIIRSAFYNSILHMCSISNELFYLFFQLYLS